MRREPNLTEECTDLNAVRRNIDRFKRDGAEVLAPERAAQVIANARRLALELGGDPDVAEWIYREVVRVFTDLELRAHRR